jgi:superoxide dismutase, Fe-Mn family
MVTQLSASSVGIQGSGWGWLGYNKTNNRLEIATCANQDPLAPTTGKKNRILILIIERI